MYDKLIEELRQHHCDAKEDDTQEVCEECAYDVIIADKSVPSGIASVCVCGLMNRAADAIENVSKAYRMMAEAYEAEVTKSRWIPVTEQLPEKYVSVWTYSKFGMLQDEYIGEYDGENYFARQTTHVTHWQPLPEPPRESES